MTVRSHRTFYWEECADALEALASDPGVRLDPERGVFESEALRIRPPLVYPIPDDCPTLARFLETLPEMPGRQVVLLLQAGAVSLGLFEGGEERATKSFKKYVVRGKGRAQPSHLATKGKSRYGSRLRLQNARRLLEDTNAKLHAWQAEFGPADQVYYSAPIRIWAELFGAKPAPPFEKTERLIRIPLDLPKPTTEVLRRTYRALSYGRIEERTLGEAEEDG